MSPAIHHSYLAKALITALATITGLTQPASAKGSVEATQLDYVALDASVDCNRIFFRSSQHFKGTIFAMPRVMAGGGPDGFRTIDIVPSVQPGEYILNIRFFFPANDDSLKISGASSQKRDLNNCNLDTVKASINRDIQNKNDRVHTIARIPLTSMEVSLPGISSTGKIGLSADRAEEVDILDYYGKSLTAVFTISEAEKDYFQSRVVSPDGLAAVIKFRFQARHRDGSVHAEINVDALKANFSAAVKGQASIAKVDLESKIRASFDNNSITITSEAGNSNVGTEMQKQIINKILSEVSLSVEALAATSPGTAEAKSDEEQVAVKAVLEILSSRVSRHLEFNQIATPETATAQTEVSIRASRLSDPNLQQVEVKAQYQDRSQGIPVLAGQTLAISAAYQSVDKIVYENAINTYLTTSQIAELGLSTHFPDITNPKMAIQNQVINGIPMAIGVYSPIAMLRHPSRYRWLRTKVFPTREQISWSRIEPILSALASLPVKITFSALGDRRFFSFAELVSENRYWKGVFNALTGQLVLTAKRDLGTLQFREVMKNPEDYEVGKEKVVLDQVVEEKHRPIRGPIAMGPAVELMVDSGALTKQRVIVFNVTRPTTQEQADALRYDTYPLSDVTPPK